ncbi:MAG: orotate phosphoribosyltransferase [Gammaproteobacteria bacterium]|nr:orotate phosphoribosyltransferase [Rhodocyclaceae bacterium]MBU3908000.1 orotate phosphoribosyltransferase [Gammaproteobacteria bacterium]MBU3990618.1 orotate phosphoribosyltransferase [Gammaproteobacteria bacterium]MBU4006069.1 orotate phosphoribosyltransferase [Gammaproteobacteria bacterium]MBU4022070.1 orotate phosphoribosyltransferase [Gammaproteobacteria bacterium]
MSKADFSREFIAFACDRGVLRFGEFKTKAGRLSPYFFNAGLFNDGAALGRLADFYAQTILAADIEFDMLFGPAYKGIPLVAATAMALATRQDGGRNFPFAYNRKEAKDHGEGGSLIGAPLAGRVLIVDDVISAGTSVRESVEIIRAWGGTPAGVIIAIDRQERGTGTLSAVQEVEQNLQIPVVAVARLTDLIDYLADQPALEQNLVAVSRYRETYGVA